MNEKDLKRIDAICGEKPIKVKEAFELQRDLSSRVVKKNGFKRIKMIAGADLAILTKDKKLVCGIIVFNYPDLEIIERAWSITEESFPYIPGLLAFREGPSIIETYKKLNNKPDIMMIDGQGLAHPRSFGIACHIGVLLDIPTIGVGKKKLCGNYTEPGVERGSYSFLKSAKDETLGVVLRTKNNAKPVYVSVGHKVGLKTSMKIVLACYRGYRIPEPTRLADIFVSKIKKEINPNA